MPEGPSTSATAAVCSRDAVSNSAATAARSEVRPTKGTSRGPGAATPPRRASSAALPGRAAGSRARRLAQSSLQIGGHAGDEGARRPRVAGDLLGEDLVDGALEGEQPRERLVEEHAHRVPVARGGGGGPLDDLRGEELGRPDDGEAALLRRAAEPYGQAEVDEDHPPLGRHQHVRGLDVAVQARRSGAAPRALRRAAPAPSAPAARRRRLAAWRARARAPALPALAWPRDRGARRRASGPP